MLAIDACLSYPSKKEQRCLFQSSVDEIKKSPSEALGGD